MTLREIAKATFRHFASKPGNQHIASETALFGIMNTLESRSCTAILELGIGIGTIPYALNYAKANGRLPKLRRYVGTEANEFCIAAFKDNCQVSHFSFEHQLFLQHVDDHNRFDLVVIDGEESSLEVVLTRLNRRGVIFFEGDRLPQRKIISGHLKSLKRSFVMIPHISNKRNRSYGPFSTIRFMGGYTIFILDPTWMDHLHYVVARIKVAVKYRLRIFLDLFDFPAPLKSKQSY